MDYLQIRQTLIAGLIAGIVVACSYPFTEFVGDVVGEEVAPTGVAHALEDAGSDYDAEDDDSVEQACDCPMGDTPRPHFVLRDRNGEAVVADVWPSCGANRTSDHHEECMSSPFKGVSDFPCVLVNYLGQQQLDVYYELATGLPGPCNYLDGTRANPPPAISGALDSPPYTIEVVY